MSRILIFIVFLFAISGCTSNESDYTVKVLGDLGLQFTGNYTVVMSGGESISKSVEGAVPTRWNIRGKTVSCTFQNQSGYGKLVVEIWREGKLLAASETSARYGTVSAATR